MFDIYFEPNYGKLYEKIENGTSEFFEYKSELGNISHMFIKREIPIKLNNKTYFDIVTPYGYGGPIILDKKEGLEKKLISRFNEEFSKYCRENHIVSEFVRFHPIFNNAKDFSSIYDTTYLRKTVGTKIEPGEDPFQTEFSKSTRKTIRRALKAGVTYKVTKKPSDISNFIDIYYSTMDRNKASDYYYFDRDYFDNCLKYFHDNILLIEVEYDNKIIAMGFYFVFNQIIHAHLSGTLTEYLKLSPAYVIKYATAQWASENGIKLIHYGGGTSNSEDDSLYKFKKKFTKETEFEFYVGKKIWNTEIYDELCRITNVDKSTDFFPAYRTK